MAKRKKKGIVLRVEEGRVRDKRIIVKKTSAYPSIKGVRVTQRKSIIEQRRALTLVHSTDDPPNTLGYAVAITPGEYAAGHSHNNREEHLILLHGCAHIRLIDIRKKSPTKGRVNVLNLTSPGQTLEVPPGVAHFVRADGLAAVLFVFGSCDYDPHDDTPSDIGEKKIKRSR